MASLFLFQTPYIRPDYLAIFGNSYKEVGQMVRVSAAVAAIFLTLATMVQSVSARWDIFDDPAGYSRYAQVEAIGRDGRTLHLSNGMVLSDADIYRSRANDIRAGDIVRLDFDDTDLLLSVRVVRR